MTAVTDETLAAVPVGPKHVRVYLRHCYIPDRGDPDPLWVNPSVESRWWTADGTLYVAEEIETVMAEHCRNSGAQVGSADPTGGIGLNPQNFTYYASQPVGAPLPARAVCSVDVAFDRLADLRSTPGSEALQTSGVQPSDLLADDYGPCPEIAQRGEQLGWQAIRAQSAANLNGVALAIFRGAFPPPDDWRLDRDTVSPSIRIAYLTRYRAGQRPEWLGA